MSRFGFIGPTYQLLNVNADCQRCINWYPETDESQMGKSAMVLNPTPGLSQFIDLNGHQVRGLWTINGRTFAVCDTQLYEVLANGTKNALGTVANDGNPVYMVASPQQLAVASGGFLYVFYLQTVGTVNAGTFVTVPANTFPGPVDVIGYSDGFFIALIALSQQYFVSNALDATTWPALNTNIISTFPDNVVSMIVDHRQIALFGSKATEFDYDTGNIPVPFGAAPGGFMEEGCGAEFATVQLDNSIFWIGQRNDRGQGIGWRTNGYSPVRVTNHSVESIWATYPTLADARAFPYQDGGHSFWHINFPSGNATWVYDVATGMWHERGYWFEQAGIYQAALPQCHTFNFGKHLVGDRQSGKIYQMAMPAANGSAWNFVTDNGNPIRRMRRAPIISTENKWIYYKELTIDLMTGLGPQPPLLDGAGKPRDPMLTLRYSNDSGITWSNGRDVPCGQAGNYLARAVARRLGRARRGRVFEVTCSDPIPWYLTDAYLEANPGFEAQERIPKQYGKVA
jgi:hypothetical protein